MYTSFWVKFDQLRNGMTILDTGNEGITFQYQDQKLMALIYESSDEVSSSPLCIKLCDWIMTEPFIMFLTLSLTHA